MAKILDGRTGEEMSQQDFNDFQSHGLFTEIGNNNFGNTETDTLNNDKGYQDTVSSEYIEQLFKSLGINSKDVPPYIWAQLEVAYYSLYRAKSDAQRDQALANLNEILGSLQSYLYNELNYNRTLPINQYIQLLATGMSPTAAKAALTGASPQQGYEQADLATGALGGDELAMQGVQTALQGLQALTGTAVGINQLYQSAQMFGFNLQAAQAAAQLGQVNADVANSSFAGQRSASQLMNTVNALKQTGAIAEDVTSVDELLSMISSLSESGNVIASNFMSNGYDGMNTYYGRMYANQMLNGNVDNEFYRNNKQAELALQDFNGQLVIAQTMSEQQNLNKILADIDLTNSQKSLVDNQAANEFTRGQNMQREFDDAHNLSVEQQKALEIANRAAECDTAIKEATFDDIKAITMQKVHDQLVLLQTALPDEQRSILKTLINDRESAMYLSCLGRLFNSNSYEYWSNPKYEEQRKMLAAFGNDNVHSCLESLALVAETESKNVSVGHGQWTTGYSVPTAAFLCDLFYGHSTKSFWTGTTDHPGLIGTRSSYNYTVYPQFEHK